MKISEQLKPILRTRHYLLTEENITDQNSAYLNAYLLSNFGIVVDKPNLLTRDMIRQLDDDFHLQVPNSFYSNPQDTSHFTASELLIEQIVAYFAYGSDLGRIEVFKKDLPSYVVGDELKLRTFYIVTEEEAISILTNIMNSYCAYTRPFSIDELDEFIKLFTAGFYTNKEIKCKDNIISMLALDNSLARFLDRKDIVKMSIQRFGNKANFKSYNKQQLTEIFSDIACYIPYVKSCPLTKKQAKYFNKITSICKLNIKKETNDRSPDKLALKLMNAGDIVGAANIYANSGSMLERRIKMLLSRASAPEAFEILNMLPANNPIVLYQLMSNLASDDSDSRTFTFFCDNKVKTHRETEYETRFRKSKLTAATRKFLVQVCLDKIKEYYKNLPTLGKVYIADNFYKLGIPTNTSASGKGIDVLPIGSRVPCVGSKVRTFVHWKNAFDIDSSLIVVGPDNTLYTEGWFSYSSKRFGNNVLFSGDITGRNGAEYFDIDLDALEAEGYKYVVQTFHGYSSKLNSGEIYAGYQNKKNLNTKAWDPKNIEMQFNVFGDSRGCIAFAIDIKTREVIILNQIVDSDDRVIRPSGFKTIEKYLNPDYLAVTVGMIAECRGERVSKPEEADIVFDDVYVQATFENDESDKKQTIIRSYELEKLVSLVNE